MCQDPGFPAKVGITLVNIQIGKLKLPHPRYRRPAYSRNVQPSLPMIPRLPINRLESADWKSRKIRIPPFRAHATPNPRICHDRRDQLSRHGICGSLGKVASRGTLSGWRRSVRLPFYER